MVYSAGNDSGSTSTERIIKSSISDGCYIFVASYKSGNDFAINYYDGSTVQNIISSRAANTFLYDDGSQLWYSKYGDSATSGRPTLHVVM